LEKVFLKYPYQPVKKGQKIAEIYSPELVNAQRELLFLLENDPGNESLIQSSKERLRLLGVTENQLSALIQKKETKNTFSIYSPYEGYVLSETQQTPITPMAQTSSPSGAMGDAMGSTSNTPSQTSTATPSATDPLIREGSYVTAGQTLFKVVGSSALRVELNVPGSWSGSIKKSDEASLDFGEHHHQAATVDFIQPFYSNGQEFLTVRIYTRRTENLHIGHLVDAELNGNTVESLWIPGEAIVDLGNDRIVFLKDRNVFKAKRIITGAQADNLVEVKQGLSSSDEIASNAHYLVDSESFIKTQK
jgi:hypothetical protein